MRRGWGDSAPSLDASGLGDLDQLELSTRFELEALELDELDLSRPLLLVHGVALLSSLPSSVDAGRIIALYGPSTSKKMDCSRCLTYSPVLGEALVLRVGAVAVDIDVEHHARV